MEVPDLQGRVFLHQLQLLTCARSSTMTLTHAAPAAPVHWIGMTCSGGKMKRFAVSDAQSPQTTSSSRGRDAREMKDHEQAKS